MNTEQFESVVQASILILSIVVGFGGIVPIVNWLKELLNISGRPVQILAGVVSLVLALVMGLAQGLLVPESFEPEIFTATLLAMLTLSQTEYGRWLRAQES